MCIRHILFNYGWISIISTSISTTISTPISAQISTHISTRISTHIPTHLYTYLDTYLNNYLGTYLDTYLNNYLGTYLDTYLDTYLCKSVYGILKFQDFVVDGFIIRPQYLLKQHFISLITPQWYKRIQFKYIYTWFNKDYTSGHSCFWVVPMARIVLYYV